MAWESTASLRRSRGRVSVLAFGLASLALLWLAGLSGGDSSAVLGVVILEIFTLVPLAVTVARLRGIHRKLAQVQLVGEEEQRRRTMAMQAVDEELLHVGRLVALLRPGPAREAGGDALAAAEKATEVRKRLLQRRDELAPLGGLAVETDAQGTIAAQLGECQRRLEQTQTAVDDLAAQIAKLVEAAEDNANAPALERVRDATERTAAIAEALEELSAPRLLADGTSSARLQVRSVVDEAAPESGLGIA